MSIKYNGTEISAVNYNGTELTKVIYNGTTVWESTVTYPITVSSAYCSGYESNPTTIAEGGTATLYFVAGDEAYHFTDNSFGGLSGATLQSYTHTETLATIVIANPTGNVSFSIIAEPASTTETWLIAETPTELGDLELTARTGLSFVSNGTTFTGIEASGLLEMTPGVIYYYTTYPTSIQVYGEEYPLTGWASTAYRTIEIDSSTITDEVRMWLEQFATQQT